MKYSEQPLQTFRLRNFKAVRDSGVVKFTPLTVFIGNNGSGKSSLIEGLETYQVIVTEGLGEAAARWRGFENILNRAVSRRPVFPDGQRPCLTHPMTWKIRGSLGGDEIRRRAKSFTSEMEVNASPDFSEIFIQSESNFPYTDDSTELLRDSNGQIRIRSEGKVVEWSGRPRQGTSSMRDWGLDGRSWWQFLDLRPDLIGQPRQLRRIGPSLTLQKHGQDLGEFLLDLIHAEGGEDIMNGIIDTIRYVLPYAADIRATVTTELQRSVFVTLTEQDFRVPGWLLSTGTLRLLAILAVLRHPNAPRLVFIEEVENGLDPRTLNLILDEIQRATESGRTQVVCTTHSPYFLDLLHLSQIILVERNADGEPTFTRPDPVALETWKNRFAPGKLYTMGVLNREYAGVGA